MLKKILFSLFCFNAFFCSLYAQLDILEEAEQMPYFQGCSTFENGSEEKRQCSNNALIKYIASSLTYPETAKGTGLEGTVYVSFVVDQDGKVVQPKVLRDIGGGCGEEAIRVLNEMPDWEAATVSDEPVNIMLKLPLHFSLKDAEPDWSSDYKIYWGNIKSDKVTKEDLKTNLKEEIIFRDKFGNSAYVTDLRVIFEKDGNIIEGKSKGFMSKSLQKIIKKAKVGGSLTITGNLQHKGEFILVGRTMDVVE